jgi:ectoine hydroxylase-related dioxygenase (phytanoyl-CoA dioxygenase family)
VSLDDAYSLQPEQVDFYRENGFVRLASVFTTEELAAHAADLRPLVAESRAALAPIDERDTYGRAFVQVMNLWRRSEAVRRFVFGRRLARIAAELMGTRGVRLYHDQALFKEPAGGHTPWHADQYYWPLASAHSCTAWIPLQPVPLEMGPLAFAAGSHKVELGRELPISDESEERVREGLEAAALPVVEEPFALGEVSFHAGWTFHRAGANGTSRMREVMTVIYMDAAMRLAAPRNRNQQIDWETWCPGAVVGEPIATAINPVLYP